jgi:hypothetical protein
MSRITKQIAEDVSKRMTFKQKEKYKQLKSEFENKVRDMSISRIPKKIIELFSNEETKPYIRTTSAVKLLGNGFNHNWVYVKDFPHTGGVTFNLILTPEEGDLLLKMEREYKVAEEKMEKLKVEIYTALYEGLRTFKNVEENFPEAFEYLPVLSKNTALSVNLNELRSRIKSDK